MNATPTTVVLEPSGQVRDHLSGRRIGTHDPHADAAELRKLHAYVGACSRDLRLMALAQGQLGQSDVQTQGTIATSLAPALETIADLVCPVTLVSKSSGTWLSDDVGQDLAKPVAPQVAGTSSPPELNPKLTSTSFDATNGRALAVDIAAETLANADLDLVKLSIRRLVNAFKLDREVRVANLLMTSANWPSGNRTAAAVKWNGVSPTPLVDVFGALAKSIIAPSFLVMSESASQYFYSNTSVYQHLTAGGPIPTPIVASAHKMTSGAADYVWGSTTSANAILVYAGGDPEAVSTARTFRYIGDAPDREAAKEADGYLLRSFLMDKRGARGTRSLVLAANDADAILSGQLGGIITGVIA
jgi:hypothetical protein